MLENIQERVEQLARMVVLSDAGDLPGLVALQEQSVSLAGELAEEHADDLSVLASQISMLAESIVLRSVDDTNAAFQQIGATVDRLQNALNSPCADGTLGKSSQNSSADDELITAWIGSTEGMLTEIEGKLLTLERNPTDTEVIADIRRTMHTLKGECGVLSLHAAQKVCHEAETLIDTRIDAGLSVPIDPFLMLLDWMKSYITRLSGDRSATPADDKPVLDAILAAQQAHLASSVAPATTNTEPSLTPAMNSTVVAASGSQTSSATDSGQLAGSATTESQAADFANPDPQTFDLTPVNFAAQPGTEENLPDFLCEAKDHIANSEEALLALDQDRTNNELINTVFRAFHTIKGVSGFMALKPIVSLAHSAEQLLDGARGGSILLGRAELDLILASCDLMTRLLGVLEGSTGPSRGDFDSLVQKLDAAAKTPGSGHTGNVPTKPQAAAAASTVTDATQVQSSSPHPVSSSTLSNSGTQTVIENKDTPSPSSTPSSSATSPDAEAAGSAKIRKVDQTVKVNTSRMDSLVTMVGELVIAQQMVVQDVATIAGNGQRVQRTLSHMGKMIRDLQEVSMSLRMVNLKSTFQKMTRLVRDVSQKAGKQIEVFTDGEDVELDRNVVEAITDPLVHMIRNSCDHGVEPGDDRRAVGKSPVGKVNLRAYHAGGSIVIEISDDGRGLRREKLLAKAKSKGLVPHDADESSMPDSEVFNLIFLPGFSTADKVTDISGRGVGMDVVRRNIEALRGKIEIRSNPGNGTTFLLRLPLTMAIIDGMVVRVGKQRYVLPTLSIQQSFRPKSDDVKTVVGAGEMVKVRGSMLPIYRLNRVLELTEGLTQIADALLIVMEADDSRFCLMVDEILGQHQVVIKTLTQTGQQLRGVSGGAILGDGRVALILDVAQVVSLARDGTGRPIPTRRIQTETGELTASTH